MDKNSKENDEQSIMDKSMRSVFVGNIPYDATEEKLKDIFSEVGPVLSFKLVFDRESGKPKGYGFCEYKDQETALSAMRNLNGYEIGGRSLRVDNACTEKSRMEMQALMQGPLVENPYGDPCSPEKAPEEISKAVASLPPEQMFELMKQMKQCIQNNPNEARQMLLQNPQLAYALLQAQVVMRIVDSTTAVTMLHPKTPVPPVLHPSDKASIVPVVTAMGMVPTMVPGVVPVAPVVANNMQPVMPTVPQPVVPPFAGAGVQDIDLRALEPRMMAPVRGPMPVAPPAPPPSLDQDMRCFPVQDNLPLLPEISEPMPTAFSRDPRQVNQSQPVVPPADPRQRPNDPRQKAAAAPQPATQAVAPPAAPVQNRNATVAGIPSGASDQEKAALIMQVLQLSDEQIAMLPPEQRNSILVLKEQIAKSAQRT